MIDVLHGLHARTDRGGPGPDPYQVFSLTVHPSSESAHFTMVVSFERSSFKLSEDSVSLALEAAIGGYCGRLLVSNLSDRVFSFTVSSKNVGFMILKRHSYSCKQFKCFFHLWGFGGPNWVREFAEWQKECKQEWVLVSPSKRRIQLEMNAMRASKPKSVIKWDNSVRKKLQFATVMTYDACDWRSQASAAVIGDLKQAGYKLHPHELTPASPPPVVHWTTSEPRIPFVTVKPYTIVQAEKLLTSETHWRAVTGQHRRAGNN